MFSFFVCKKHYFQKINDFPRPVCVYFSTSKPRPPKKSSYYQLVSRDRIRHLVKEPRRECERSIVIVHYLATGSVLLPKVFDLFLISADKWKMPEAIPQMME